MHTQTKTPWPSVGALWSLFWRALVLTPLAAVFGLVWAGTWPLLIALPLYEVYFLGERAWFWTAIVPVIWVLLFLFARSRWFNADRKDFPNDQENV